VAGTARAWQSSDFLQRKFSRQQQLESWSSKLLLVHATSRHCMSIIGRDGTVGLKKGSLLEIGSVAKMGEP
jgi:hypothetical protein